MTRTFHDPSIWVDSLYSTVPRTHTFTDINEDCDVLAINLTDMICLYHGPDGVQS